MEVAYTGEFIALVKSRAIVKSVMLKVLVGLSGKWEGCRGWKVGNQ